MPFPKTTEWVILGSAGAFCMKGESAAAAAKTFEKRYPEAEIHAVFLSQIVQIPPKPGDPLPFRCSVIGPGKVAT